MLKYEHIKIWASLNFGNCLIEGKKKKHLTKYYSKLAKVLVEKIAIPMFWRAHLAANGLQQVILSSSRFAFLFSARCHWIAG